MGNTCYMNAAIQALRHFPEISFMCTRGLLTAAFTEQGQHNAPIAAAYAELVQSLQSAGDAGGFVRPVGFFEALQTAVRDTPYAYFTQRTAQDAHEFIVWLLDQLFMATAEPRDVTPGQGVLRVGDLVVDTNRRQVTRDGERIALTYTEFSLLELLFREPGRVVPRAEILEQLWGYPPRRAADLRVVDVYVARLRGKLEPDPRNPELILTVRGTGYASQRMGDAGMAAVG